jgi:hypothetical protein
MSYEKRIFEFIQQNEPTTRKEILEEFPTVAPKTVYQNVNKLLEKEKIHQTPLRTLTVSETIPQWIIPIIFSTYRNYSNISNAFARQHPEFLKEADEIVAGMVPNFAALLADLIIILNASDRTNGAELAKHYKFTKKVDYHEVQNRLNLIKELISQYTYDKSESTIE